MDNKMDAINQILKSINKQYGKGSLMFLDQTNSMDVEVVPSGILSLDLALGVGGFPRGRIAEIYGPEAAGKSLLLQILMGSSQSKGGYCALIDVEHAFTPNFAKQFGVDPSKLVINQPNSAEQALSIAEELIKSNQFDVVGIDSVAALVPERELEGGMGDAHVALQGRLMSQALRKLTAITGDSKTILVFINQIRMKIPMPGQMVWGNNEETPGGRALKFYCSLRLNVTSGGQKFKDKGTKVQCGHRVKVKVVKNKVSAPFSEAYFNLFYRPFEGKAVGIDKGGMLLDEAVKRNLITLDGKSYFYKGERLGVGEFNSGVAIDGNVTLQQELSDLILKTPVVTQVLPTTDETEEDTTTPFEV